MSLRSCGLLAEELWPERHGWNRDQAIRRGPDPLLSCSTAGMLARETDPLP